MVAISGTVNAAIRVGTVPNLLTPYGILVLVKVVALGALGAVSGRSQRRVLIARLVTTGSRRFFWIMLTAELAFMGVAFGVASGLAVSAPPVEAVSAASSGDSTPAEILTGRPLPPPLTPLSFITSWDLDLLWGADRRLRHRVLHLGCRPAAATRRPLALVPDGALAARNAHAALGDERVTNVYEQFLFSEHMLEHMLLTMANPLMLVLSAPITLSLRAIPQAGRRQPRRAGMDPARGALAGRDRADASAWCPARCSCSRSGCSTTRAVPLGDHDHVGHEWMILHFLSVGYLFAQTLVGIDPVRNRPPYPMRLILPAGGDGVHAFFGLALISNTGLLLPDCTGEGRTWGATPLADQQAAGGIAWSVGEIPTVLLAIGVAVLWSRSDDRENRRRDRRVDRDGDAELDAYNEMLAQRAGPALGHRGHRQGARRGRSRRRSWP